MADFGQSIFVLCCVGVVGVVVCGCCWFGGLRSSGVSVGVGVGVGVNAGLCGCECDGLVSVCESV